MFRKIASLAAGASMLVSSAAYAADTSTNVEQGALAPGNASGIHEAQAMDFDLTMGLVFLTVAAVGIIFAVTSSGNGGHSTTGTTQNPA